MYRHVSLNFLLAKLATTNVNLLAIGRQSTYIVNAAGHHKRHFVGTMLPVGLTQRASEKRSWDKIHNFVQRFASLGTTIKVYGVDEENDQMRYMTEFRKIRIALYQPPGCYMQGTNGIKKPWFVHSPIEAEKLEDSWLVGWEQAKETIVDKCKNCNRKKDEANNHPVDRKEVRNFPSKGQKS